MGRAHRLLIVDDDTIYGRLLSAAVQAEGFEPVFAESLGDLGSIGLLTQFDAAVIDYHLESMQGDEIAEYVERFLIRIPVLIVSGDDDVAKKRQSWPKCVHGFISKNGGIQAVVQELLRVVPRGSPTVHERRVYYALTVARRRVSSSGGISGQNAGFSRQRKRGRLRVPT